MYFIFGNYGNNTIAAIQWAYLNRLTPVCVVHINTGWGASDFKGQISKGQRLALDYGFSVKELVPSHSFPTLIRDRQSFPNAKYQWCATFLKALPLLAFLDETDDCCEGVILLGSRREDSRARQHLTEYIEESEHFGGRKVWYPLYNLSTHERNHLIMSAGVKILPHRSLECHPCIHSQLSEFKFLEAQSADLIESLEQEIGQTMFHARYPQVSITQLMADSQHQTANDPSLEIFDMGCGSKYVCGE